MQRRLHNSKNACQELVPRASHAAACGWQRDTLKLVASGLDFVPEAAGSDAVVCVVHLYDRGWPLDMTFAVRLLVRQTLTIKPIHIDRKIL